MGQLYYKVDEGRKTGRVGKCDIKIYRTDDKDVVIATELDDNPGPSITNSCVPLANSVWQEFNLDKNNFIWIEHYIWPDNEHYDVTEFDIVDGYLANPRWKPITTEEIKKLIDGEIL